MKIGNYAPSFLKTAMAPEGSYDILNYDAAKLKTETTTKEIRELGAVDSSSDSSIPAEVHQYEFIIIPNIERSTTKTSIDDEIGIIMTATAG